MRWRKTFLILFVVALILWGLFSGSHILSMKRPKWLKIMINKCMRMCVAAVCWWHINYYLNIFLSPVGEKTNVWKWKSFCALSSPEFLNMLLSWWMANGNYVNKKECCSSGQTSWNGRRLFKELKGLRGRNESSFDTWPFIWRKMKSSEKNHLRQSSRMFEWYTIAAWYHVSGGLRQINGFQLNFVHSLTPLPALKLNLILC